MKPLDVLLALGAAMRLTRFLTTDTLGDWLLVRPAKRWANRHESDQLLAESAVHGSLAEQREYNDAALNLDPNPELGWRSKLVSGIECPFCVGFWITAATIVGGVLAARGPHRRAAFRLIAGIFAANYLTAHIGSRLDH